MVLPPPTPLIRRIPFMDFLYSGTLYGLPDPPCILLYIQCLRILDRNNQLCFSGPRRQATGPRRRILGGMAVQQIRAAVRISWASSRRRLLRQASRMKAFVNAKRVRHPSQPSVADSTELKGKSKFVNVDAIGRNECKNDHAPVTPGAIFTLPLGCRSPLYRVAKPTMERIVVLPSFRPSII